MSEVLNIGAVVYTPRIVTLEPTPRFEVCKATVVSPELKPCHEADYARQKIKLWDNLDENPLSVRGWEILTVPRAVLFSVLEYHDLTIRDDCLPPLLPDDTIGDTLTDQVFNTLVAESMAWSSLCRVYADEPLALLMAPERPECLDRSPNTQPYYAGPPQTSGYYS